MNAEQIKQLVAEKNRKATELNNKRNQMVGMQEAAQRSYEKAKYVYKEKYGVDLTSENLKAEYDKVLAQAQADINELTSAIEKVETGGQDVVIPASVPQQVGGFVNAPVQPIPQAPAQPAQQAFAQPAQQFVQPTVQQQAPAQPAPVQHQHPVQQDFQQFAQPVAQPMATDFGGNPQAPVAQEDISEQAFAPAGWGTPVGNAQPTGMKFE